MSDCIKRSIINQLKIKKMISPLNELKATNEQIEKFNEETSFYYNFDKTVELIKPKESSSNNNKIVSYKLNFTKNIRDKILEKSKELEELDKVFFRDKNVKELHTIGQLYNIFEHKIKLLNEKYQYEYDSQKRLKIKNERKKVEKKLNKIIHLRKNYQKNSNFIFISQVFQEFSKRYKKGIVDKRLTDEEFFNVSKQFEAYQNIYEKIVNNEYLTDMPKEYTEDFRAEFEDFKAQYYKNSFDILLDKVLKTDKGNVFLSKQLNHILKTKIKDLDSKIELDPINKDFYKKELEEIILFLKENVFLDKNKSNYDIKNDFLNRDNFITTDNEKLKKIVKKIRSKIFNWQEDLNFYSLNFLESGKSYNKSSLFEELNSFLNQNIDNRSLEAENKINKLKRPFLKLIKETGQKKDAFKDVFYDDKNFILNMPFNIEELSAIKKYKKIKAEYLTKKNIKYKLKGRKKRYDKILLKRLNGLILGQFVALNPYKIPEISKKGIELGILSKDNDKIVGQKEYEQKMIDKLGEYDYKSLVKEQINFLEKIGKIIKNAPLELKKEILLKNDIFKIYDKLLENKKKLKEEEKEEPDFNDDKKKKNRINIKDDYSILALYPSINLRNKKESNNFKKQKEHFLSSLKKYPLLQEIYNIQRDLNVDINDYLEKTQYQTYKYPIESASMYNIDNSYLNRPDVKNERNKNVNFKIPMNKKHKEITSNAFKIINNLREEEGLSPINIDSEDFFDKHFKSKISNNILLNIQGLAREFNHYKTSYHRVSNNTSTINTFEGFKNREKYKKTIEKLQLQKDIDINPTEQIPDYNLLSNFLNKNLDRFHKSTNNPLHNLLQKIHKYLGGEIVQERFKIKNEVLNHLENIDISIKDLKQRLEKLKDITDEENIEYEEDISGYKKIKKELYYKLKEANTNKYKLNELLQILNTEINNKSVNSFINFITRYKYLVGNIVSTPINIATGQRMNVQYFLNNSIISTEAAEEAIRRIRLSYFLKENKILKKYNDRLKIFEDVSQLYKGEEGKAIKKEGVVEKYGFIHLQYAEEKNQFLSLIGVLLDLKVKSNENVTSNLFDSIEINENEEVVLKKEFQNEENQNILEKSFSLETKNKVNHLKHITQGFYDEPLHYQKDFIKRQLFPFINFIWNHFYELNHEETIDKFGNRTEGRLQSIAKGGVIPMLINYVGNMSVIFNLPVILLKNLNQPKKIWGGIFSDIVQPILLSYVMSKSMYKQIQLDGRINWGISLMKVQLQETIKRMPEVFMSAMFKRNFMNSSNEKVKEAMKNDFFKSKKVEELMNEYGKEEGMKMAEDYFKNNIGDVTVAGMQRNITNLSITLFSYVLINVIANLASNDEDDEEQNGAILLLSTLDKVMKESEAGYYNTVAPNNFIGFELLESMWNDIINNWGDFETNYSENKFTAVAKTLSFLAPNSFFKTFDKITNKEKYGFEVYTKNIIRETKDYKNKIRKSIKASLMLELKDKYTETEIDEYVYRIMSNYSDSVNSGYYLNDEMIDEIKIKDDDLSILTYLSDDKIKDYIKYYIEKAKNTKGEESDKYRKKAKEMFELLDKKIKMDNQQWYILLLEKQAILTDITNYL